MIVEKKCQWIKVAVRDSNLGQKVAVDTMAYYYDNEGEPLCIVFSENDLITRPQVACTG